MARGCARIDSRLDTAKIGSDGRVEVHRARLLAVFGDQKRFHTPWTQSGSRARLFDHLVGGYKKGLRHPEAERLRGLEVDHQLEFCRLHDRQGAGLRALENFSALAFGL